MRRNALHIIFFCLALALSQKPAQSQGDLITHVDIDEFTISPDGDGIQDSLVMTYILSDTAFSVSAFVLTSDSPQALVDTFLSEEPQGAGTYTISWDGTDYLGATVAQGQYEILLHAFNGTSDDSVTEIVRVDLTPPIVHIESHEPGIFAPGIDIRSFFISFEVDSSPPEDLDAIKISINDPDGNHLVDLTTDQPFQGNGSYTATWDGEEATKDGIHKITITVADLAGYEASAWAEINVDLQAPELTISSLPDRSELKACPDSLFGWTRDRNGINLDSLRFSANDTLYEQITSTFMHLDTLYFSIPLTGEIKEEGEHVLFFKSQDVVKRESKISFHITIDTASPPPPVLDNPPDRIVRNPIYTLTGTIPGSAQRMKIFRNDSFIDSIASPPTGKFSYQTDLLPGSNIFKAFSIDQAGNESPFSNEIEIVFDNTAGIFIPQPFRPNDDFQINLTKEARLVRIRLYDLGGELVNIIDKTASGTSIAINWDGLNGDRKNVARGPLVAVTEIQYTGGGKEILRKIFLFNP